MAIETSQMNVLHAPLQPLTQQGDSTHPTGYFRDGHCWGSQADVGQHYIGAIVTDDFLRFSKARGNDLMTPRAGFPGLREGCRWCLCVQRWKEAFLASSQLGDKVVPKVDLDATALSALNELKLDDLRRFQYQSGQ